MLSQDPDDCEPPDEVCNQADDDCDGVADNGMPCQPGEMFECTTTCGSTGRGRCTDSCEPPPSTACSPPDEECNGDDDDCDGEVDEGLVEDCRGDSRRVCDDGRWSRCHDCTVCIPDSYRYCNEHSYCSRWGEQRCNSDGNGWSQCIETYPPGGCDERRYDATCCIAAGACCEDLGDSDGDGRRHDPAGNCAGVECPLENMTTES